MAKDIGGVVHPPVYLGADIIRPYSSVKAFGFKERHKIWGMDFPGFKVKSGYWDEKVVSQVVKELVRVLTRMGYKIIVLVNGHGGVNQVRLLQKLAKKLSRRERKVLYFIDFWGKKGAQKNIGHADLYEASVSLYHLGKAVDLKRLPSKGPLKCKDYGIVDSKTFALEPTKDFTCRADPRKAAAGLGEKMIKEAKKEIGRIILQEEGK